MSEFTKFPKIPRLNRECIITEKIDGTNGQIEVRYAYDEAGEVVDYDVRAGSRNRWITPGKTTDNYGFAAWAYENAAFLAATLGEGTHYGEWFGQGIARNYGLEERRFALFNTARWAGLPENDIGLTVVPVLRRTDPDLLQIGWAVEDQINALIDKGSAAVPGFMKPEGIVVFHTAANQLFKVTLENDEGWKGNA